MPKEGRMGHGRGFFLIWDAPTSLPCLACTVFHWVSYLGREMEKKEKDKGGRHCSACGGSAGWFINCICSNDNAGCECAIGNSC